MKLKHSAFVSTSVTVIVLCLGYFHFGPRHGLDSLSYIRLWEDILEYYQHSPEFAKDADIFRNVMFPRYLIPGVMLGSAYSMFDEFGHDVIILMNISLYGAIVWMLVKTWRLLNFLPEEAGWSAVIISLFLCFGLVDVPIWVYYDLSDVIFFFLVTLVIYLSLLAVFRKRVSFLILVVALTGCGFFVRPTVVVLPLAIVLVTSLIIDGDRFGFLSLATVLVMFVASLGVLFGMPAIIDAWENGLNVERYLPHFLVGTFRQSAVFYNYGWVVADRPETFVQDPSGYWDYLDITLSRFAYYYIPLRSGYSTVHNILNSVYLIITVCCAIYGFLVSWKRDDKNKRTVVVVASISLLFGLMHAITLNSYDWRYQLPAMFPLWILAGAGAYNILLRLKGANHRKIVN